ncbi:small glutamine-rich tetratricopeptide repeat-containing protein beta [Spea bombifrons]|uniref:small glutamine-rich tetratricopeptide repeat-containing protein beta n=1 Tax=Spea bombifrons TaxID=233779 RepID=UPI002349460D|nr:small glutamine-rich tetratricopeptide repeat-containing protein beta [Spea bombifrons]XP_053313919.1 small glutamine-rich tetratricopeptide repeat-containing protein beta [Spea bombifrons]
MSSLKRLVYAVIHFLREQSQRDDYTSDEQESLEVAVQCLETVFKIGPEDTHLATPKSLEEMFSQAYLKKEELTPIESFSSLPADIEKAEQLKDEGNNFMKEQNYEAAVDCYTQAVELDPKNAVYYCNRAAAFNQLGNHSNAVRDCEKAISIDVVYSKAYGRMGKALAAMNKYKEAIGSYQKALDLDPDNESYKSNLRLAEQKLRHVASPTSAGFGFDMTSLMNNPAFVSMAASLMQDPQIQRLMSGMMSNSGGGPAAGVGGLTDLSSLIQAGQQFAQQIQQQNPELIQQLRNQVRSRSFSGTTEEHS